MAEIKFSCPLCTQHIACDELWGGHQIQCPGCKGELTVPVVPKAAAPPGPMRVSAPPPPPSAGGNPLVPPVPAAGKLSIGAQAHSAGTAAAPPPKNIPVRNLTPPPPKKGSAALKYAKVAAVVAVLGVGGYFGFKFIMDYQAKQNEKSAKEARN